MDAKQQTEADNKERSKMIEGLIMALDKFAPTKNDLFYVLNSINEITEFMIEQRFCHDSNLMTKCNSLSEVIKENANWTGNTFKNIAETVSKAVIIAGQNVEGLSILNDMEPDFRVIMGYDD